MLRNEPRTHRRLNQNCASRAVQRKRSKFCTHLAGHILTYHLSVRTTYKLNSTDDVVVVGLIYRKRIRSVLLRSRRYDRAAMINIGCVCFPPVCLHLSRGRNERLVPQIQSQGASPDNSSGEEHFEQSWDDISSAVTFNLQCRRNSTF